MKILQINDFYHKTGGTEIYIDRITKKLKELGHDISLLFGVPRPSDAEVISCNGIFVPDIHISGNRMIINSTIEMIKKEKFEIVYLHNIFNPIFMGALREVIPVIKFVHDHRFYCLSGEKYLSKIKRICPFSYHPLRCFLMAYLTNCASRNPVRLLKRISQCGSALSQSKNFDGIVVFSQSVKKYLYENKIENEKIAVINHFASSNSSNAEKRDASMLLYAGRISREKGVDYMLKAVAGLKMDYKLVIAGDGYYLPNIKKLADKLGISEKIKFAGWLTEIELNDYYKRAAALIFPSLWPEPFGISGIEAMAHGMPVIAFNTGAVSEWLIDKETGFLVKPEDIIEMRKKIELFLKNTKLAHDMGIRGRELVEKQFTIEKHIKNLLIATSEAVKHY